MVNYYVGPAIRRKWMIKKALWDSVKCVLIKNCTKDSDTEKLSGPSLDQCMINFFPYVKKNLV